MTKITQSRNYCFTDFELLNIEDIYNDYKDIIRYIGYGKEVCPSTKKIHYQGWIQFTTKRRLGGAKKIMGSKKIHMEACLGSERDNDKYCSKESKYTSYGKFITQGQRTDLEGMINLIEEGTPMLEIARSNPQTFVQYHNGLTKYKGLVEKENSKKFRAVEVEYIHGPTGTGKTRRAMEESNFKIEGSQLNWWDGYEGEKCICIDEYSNDISITHLLNILDGYQLRLPIKGGFTYANWTKVYITSNLAPQQLHENAKQIHRNALFRRITKTTLLENADNSKCA